MTEPNRLAARCTCLPAARAAVTLAVSILAIAAAQASGAAQGGPNPTPVRSTKSWGLALVAEGCQRSPSFRALVDRLRHTNLVIYVEPSPNLPGVMIGVTQFIGVNGEYRYLRVSIDPRASRKKLIAVIGHELQHAVEIGGSPEVVDQETLKALYRRIGDESVDGYDTEAARAVGTRVFDELWNREAGPPRPGSRVRGR